MWSVDGFSFTLGNWNNHTCYIKSVELTPMDDLLKYLYQMPEHCSSAHSVLNIPHTPNVCPDGELTANFIHIYIIHIYNVTHWGLLLYRLNVLRYI